MGQFEMIEAKFVSKTQVRGIIKHRWECPNCRQIGKSECRFNLDPKKDGEVYNCRFCKIRLLLKRE